jgi:hypothetical protein
LQRRDDCNDAPEVADPAASRRKTKGKGKRSKRGKAKRRKAKFLPAGVGVVSMVTSEESRWCQKKHVW